MPLGMILDRIFNFKKKYVCTFFAVMYFFVTIIGCGVITRSKSAEDILTPKEHNDLGVAYESKGEYDLAIREYKKALAKKENFYIARVNLGNVYLKTGKYKEAEEAYKEAIKTDSKIPDAFNNLAWVYIKRNDNLQEAITLCEKVLALDSKNSNIYLHTLGVVYLHKKDYDRALETLEKSINQTPADNKEMLAEAYLNLGKAYHSKGMIEKSRDAWQNVLSLGLQGEATSEAARLLEKFNLQ